MEISHSSSTTATMATYCPRLMAPLSRWKMWVSLLLNILKDEISLCTRPSATLTTTYPVALLRLGNLILSICFFYQRMSLTLFFRICEAVYIKKSIHDVFWWKFHLCISWFHTMHSRKSWEDIWSLPDVRSIWSIDLVHSKLGIVDCVDNTLALDDYARVVRVEAFRTSLCPFSRDWHSRIINAIASVYLEYVSEPS